jgi:hypothetical protein
VPDTTPDPAVTPDDIPTSITRMTYRTTQALSAAGVPVLSQNQTAVFLAQYWPAIEQHFLDRLTPAWEAVYEPGNVSDYLIGYTNDEAPAKAAAEAWFRSQYLDTVGQLDWIAQNSGADYDAWSDLVHTAPDGDESAPGITVRCRTAAPVPVSAPEAQP